MKTRTPALLAGLLAARAGAQNVLFDFDSLAAHSGLPAAYSVGGITAQFSATGQGYSIQPANTLGFTPAGFAGNCVYPNSIYASDLLISFSTPLTDFSILYAPEEYACDSSATVRVTAYLNGAFVGTATTNAVAGTWPSETLRISPAQIFNSVVVHYDAPPVTGGDYGPIFMADNMAVTPAPAPVPIILTSAAKLPDGAFQFAFTNTPSLAFRVLATTNLSLALSNWTALGAPAETLPGQYDFTDLQATNSPQRFYCVRWP